jgi:hypothetical protein
VAKFPLCELTLKSHQLCYHLKACKIGNTLAALQVGETQSGVLTKQATERMMAMQTHPAAMAAADGWLLMLPLP